MPPPSPKAKMLESLRIPDGEGMPSPLHVKKEGCHSEGAKRPWESVF